MLGETIVETIGKNVWFRLPTTPDSSNAQAYLKWVAEGNTPEPAEGAE